MREKRQGTPGTLLILSVGYGQGHHSAAAAIAEQYAATGWHCRTIDVCAAAHPAVFRLTQKFYSFCVRQAPWLWGIVYSLTGTADWARMVRSACFRSQLLFLRELLSEWSPDLVICTYPLFAYMLDELQCRGVRIPPYAVVVTDAREISRPWMRTNAPLVLMIDSGTARMVRERYGLDSDIVRVSGFPVRTAYRPSRSRRPPSVNCLQILYGAYRQTQGVENDIEAMLSAFPGMKLTVLAASRAEYMRKRFAADCESGRLVVMEKTEQMHDLLRESHLYVGKAGAATMFECYSSCVPMLVNYTLPGQEQGNLELLLEDGAGCHVESTRHLVATVINLLKNDASGWKTLCDAMRAGGRADGAKRVIRIIRDKFGI